nr:MAG TPA: hypothetical protein [Caudoviricetes sp.]
MAKQVFPGSFSGRTMKALMSFAKKDRGYNLLCTPLLWHGRIWASDQCCIAAVDWVMAAEELDNEKVYQIPHEAVEKVLVGNEYYISTITGDPQIVNLKVRDSACKLEDVTDKIGKTMSQMQTFLDASVKPEDMTSPCALAGIAPGYLANVCALAKAVGSPTINMDYRAVNASDAFPLLKVKFLGATEAADAIVAPKRA